MAHGYESASSEYEYMSQAAASIPPFTMAAWFNTTDMDYHQVVMSIANSGSDLNSFFIMAGGATAGDPAYICIRDNGGATYTVTSNGYSSGVWHHICGVFAAANDRTIVLDGDWANRGTSVVSRSPSGVNKTAIGVNCRQTLQWYMNGKIAEAAIWNAALTEAEITTLAKGYSALFVRPQNLVEYWNLFVLAPVSRITGNQLTKVGQPSKEPHPGIIYPAPTSVLGVAGGITPLVLRAIEKY
jgi:hypothetical protein